MVQELISEQFFNQVVAFVSSYTCYLTISGKKVSGNCPFCQPHKPDSHHRYFGVWPYYGKVYLGCHNPRCNFGTSNSILDFIQRIKGVDFPMALALWQEFLGIEPVSKERYLSGLKELDEACRDAYSGNGKYKQNYIIRISKRTLIEDFNWHHEELFSEVFSQMVILYVNKPHVNQKYIVQMMANYLQKLVRQEFERATVEISEHRLSPIDRDMNLSNDILDYVSYDSNFTDPLIEREERQIEQKALKMAIEILDVIELRIIIDDKFSIRKASLITGIPKSTIAYRLKKKLKQIRKMLNSVSDVR
jgi:hypothetical protein